MSYVVVTVEIDSGKGADLALPLDVPCEALAKRVMSQLGLAVRPGDNYAFFQRIDNVDRRISSDATLADAGVSDRQVLRLKREVTRKDPDPQPVGPHLRTESGEILALDSDNVVIGRRDVEQQILVDLDLSRYDPNNAVSRRHASIGRQGTEYYLIDLGSTNGTRLNGDDVPPRHKVLLHDGDSIELGDQAVRVTFYRRR